MALQTAPLPPHNRDHPHSSSSRFTQSGNQRARCETYSEGLERRMRDARSDGEVTKGVVEQRWDNVLPIPRTCPTENLTWLIL